MINILVQKNSCLSASSFIRYCRWHFGREKSYLAEKGLHLKVSVVNVSASRTNNLVLKNSNQLKSSNRV